MADVAEKVAPGVEATAGKARKGPKPIVVLLLAGVDQSLDEIPFGTAHQRGHRQKERHPQRDAGQRNQGGPTAADQLGNGDGELQRHGLSGGGRLIDDGGAHPASLLQSSGGMEHDAVGLG